ncbi:hypothetical protein IAD21_04057 [Abditibacteriota bacterium]|nr:hypothetical protein IAD21_04057 [Abditibacteriota bacterium]
MNKRWLIALTPLPFIGGLILRQIASWRPQRIAAITAVAQIQVSVSPDGKWVLAEDATFYSGSLPQSPRLIDLSSGRSSELLWWKLQSTYWTSRSRQVLKGLRPSPHWTNSSQLVFDFPDGGVLSKIVFVAPHTLQSNATFALDNGSEEKLISWSASKDDVWLLTPRRWLRFDAHAGKLLQQMPFQATTAYPGLRIAIASLSPDGQKAFVEFYNERTQTSSCQLWDLRLNRPIRRARGEWAFPKEWLNNDFYVDKSGTQRRVVDDSVLRVFSSSGKPQFRLDHENHIAIIGAKSVKWYDLTTLELIEETRLPTMKFDSLDFSSDHSVGYFSVGNEIWRVRLK